MSIERVGTVKCMKCGMVETGPQFSDDIKMSNTGWSVYKLEKLSPPGLYQDCPYNIPKNPEFTLCPECSSKYRPKIIVE